MKSFSSSVINKSGKKFAPKAPVRRAAPAPPPAPSRRASVVSQVSASHPPVGASATATPEPPPAPAEPAAPSESHVPESSSIAPSVEDAQSNQAVTAIPIPRPKRKASFSVPIARPTKDAPTPSQTSLPPSAIATSESVTQAPDRPSEDGETDVVVPSATQNKEESVIRPTATRDTQIATEIRPSKRPRTTTERTPATVVPDQTIGDTAQLVTPPATQLPAPEESRESRDESELRSATDQSGSTAKAKQKRSRRSASNETGGSKKKQRKPRTRNREPTPEGAELVEIAPSIVKMSELCKDLRTGKKSKRETELRALELAESERRRAQQEGDGSDQTPVKETPNADSPAADGESNAISDKKPQAGPVMRIVNGEIVLDTASLQVDRHADAARNAGDLEDVVENSLTRKINQATYGKRSKTESWDEEMTDLFYRGLRMFGTDFMVISKMFPGRSRRQIKLKFNNEERRDPQRIKETLMGPRESIDIHTYSEMTNTVYDDPRVIQQELDEEKRRIEEQHEKEKKAQEDLLRNADGFMNGDSAAGADKGAAKGKRNNKKPPAKGLGGGTEEILGSIDD